MKTGIAGIRYLLFGNGDAAYPPTSAGAFFKSSPDKDIPDTQLHFTAIQTPDLHGRLGIDDKHGFTAVIYIHLIWDYDCKNISKHICSYN